MFKNAKICKAKVTFISPYNIILYYKLILSLFTRTEEQSGPRGGLRSLKSDLIHIMSLHSDLVNVLYVRIYYTSH